MDDKVYYKIVVTNRRRLSVVCMQYFDEPDYEIVFDDEFETEEEAIAFLHALSIFIHSKLIGLTDSIADYFRATVREAFHRIEEAM